MLRCHRVRAVTAERRLIACLVIAGLAATAVRAAERLNVTIIDRQTGETDYSYVVPGFANAQSNSNANCAAYGSSVNCAGSTTTTATTAPAHFVPFKVRGATFTLQIPDGRVVVVNCESKFAEKFAGHRGNKRDCRVPLTNDIQAEFDGDKAKLIWPVSLDGKKMESETYKILGIFNKPAESVTVSRQASDSSRHLAAFVGWGLGADCSL